MNRQKVSKKTSPQHLSTPISKDIAPSPSYGSLSGVVQRVQQDASTVSEDERQQLEGAIGSRAYGEILAGKQTPWVPEFVGISGQLDPPIQAKVMDDVGVSEIQPENKTGLPDKLKAGIENLSGMAMDDVRVNYNSSKPSQLQALAYTQGTDIHVAPGQEKHLAHEAWHVVQQKQGLVKPTIQAQGVGINDDPVLEKRADTMGAKALRISSPDSRSWPNTHISKTIGGSLGEPLVTQLAPKKKQKTTPIPTPIPNPIVRQGPQEDEESNYGSFVHHRQLSLDKNSEQPGILVQYITRSFRVYDMKKNQLTDAQIDKTAKNVSQKADASAGVKSYYEAWYIPSGKKRPDYSGVPRASDSESSDDDFALTAIGWDKKTKPKPRAKAAEYRTSGTFTITGALTYYEVSTRCKKPLTVCNEFGFTPDLTSPAGILPYSKELPVQLSGPSVLRSSQTLSYSKTASWDGNTPDNYTGGFGETKVEPKSGDII